MSKQVNVDFVTRQIEVDTDGKEHFISAAMAANKAETAAVNAQNAATSVQKYKALWFDSVAAMKAEPSLTAGAYVNTAGYYTSNDGGGASYLIRAKADDDVDDGGSLHQLANGLVAELIIESGTVCPEYFGAKVNDGNFDSTQAINECITYAKKNKVGAIKFKNGTYHTYNTIILPSDTNIRIIIDGNGSHIVYSGNNWAIKCNSNFSDTWVTRYIVKNLNINGNVNAIGAIKAENICWYTFNNISIWDFQNGCGIQLRVSKIGDDWAWNEENLLTRCKVIRCLIGFQTFIKDDASYDGIDNSQSANGISINHNIWEYCTFNGKVDNAIGFDMNGNMARCLWHSCGGWVNEDGATNNVMYRLNGEAYGAQLIQPWVDGVPTKDTCMTIVFRKTYEYDISSTMRFVLIGYNMRQFVLKDEDIPYFSIQGNTDNTGLFYNQGSWDVYPADSTPVLDMGNGLSIICGSFVIDGSTNGNTFTRSFDGKKFKYVLYAGVTQTEQDIAVMDRVNVVGIGGYVKDEDGYITGITFKSKNNINSFVNFNYMVILRRY